LIGASPVNTLLNAGSISKSGAGYRSKLLVSAGSFGLSNMGACLRIIIITENTQHRKGERERERGREREGEREREREGERERGKAWLLTPISLRATMPQSTP
jgi:hypothetical protein